MERWDFAFDPLDIVVLKRQYAMGVPLEVFPPSSFSAPRF
jgi:hypothetical protein